MKRLWLSNTGRYALVDLTDWDRVEPLYWAEHTNGYVVSKGWGNGRAFNIYLHRMLMDPAPGFFVDHINGDRLDNRRQNLRLATKSQNMMNRGKQKNNTTGYKGVTRVNGAYVAQLQKDRKNYYLGTYATPEEAALAYNKAALAHHGEFACLNLVTGDKNHE